MTDKQKGIPAKLVIDPSKFKAVNYDTVQIFFDNNYVFHDHFQHKVKTKRFKYYQNIVKYLKENPSVKIFFTLDPEITTFRKVEDGFLINMEAYNRFCRTIENKTDGYIHAFLGQNLDVLNSAERSKYVREHATEDDIKEAIKSLGTDTQKNIIKFTNSLPLEDQKKPNNKIEISKNDFLKAFGKFVNDPTLQEAFLKKLPQIQLETLKSHRTFLKENLDKNEAFIQSWIDEENGKHRKKRCLIFGIEYIDPKREGYLGTKQFDVLAEQNRNYHVIIELKSPNAKIFKVGENDNANGGKYTTYHLSPDLSKAIPQVLGYKNWYENARPEELEAINITNSKPVSKCIIVIGKNKEGKVWMDNLTRIRNSFSNLEIWTYTDLIEKLENTINNLEQNL